MKNVFRLQSMFFFIALLMILSSVNILSQDPYFYFNGYSYRANTLDGKLRKDIAKVEITNLDNGATFTLNNSQIKKSELITTTVNDNLKDINSVEIEYLFLQENQLNAVIKSNAERNLSISVADINGRVVTNFNTNIVYGFGTVLIPTSGLSNGFYNIKIGNQTTNLAHNSFIIANNECFLNNFQAKKDINSQKLNSISGYKFVAFPYSPNHLPDTVYVESLDTINKVDFYFKDNAVYNFRTGNIKLSNVEANLIVESKRFNPAGDVTDSIYKNDTKAISLDYPLQVDVISYGGDIGCDEVFNFGQKVVFCNFVANKQLDFSVYSATITIDTKEQNLYITSSKEKSWSHFGDVGFNDNESQYTGFSTNKQIPYTIDIQTGILTGEIQITDNEFYFTYKNEYDSSNWDFENPFKITEGATRCTSYKFIPNETKIIITLIP